MADLSDFNEFVKATRATGDSDSFVRKACIDTEFIARVREQGLRLDLFDFVNQRAAYAERNKDYIEGRIEEPREEDLELHQSP